MPLNAFEAQPRHIQSYPRCPESSLPAQLILYPIGIAISCDWEGAAAAYGNILPLPPPGVSMLSRNHLTAMLLRSGTSGQHAPEHMVLQASASPPENR